MQTFFYFVASLIRDSYSVFGFRGIDSVGVTICCPVFRCDESRRYRSQVYTKDTESSDSDSAKSKERKVTPSSNQKHYIYACVSNRRG